ncbi:MAG: hypothetical protein ACRCVJ_02700 [Clostridium sp.]|uniref:hypothetical protein n=1 Tax=Clostridium sp. TaxID=1506 RepID=UPI003F34DC19
MKSDNSTNSNNTTNNIPPDIQKQLLKDELEIVNMEILGTLLFILSSFYYLDASFIGQTIIIDKLSDIPDDLDPVSLIDTGEIFSLEGVIIFTIAAYKRADLERRRNNPNLSIFNEVASSYMVTLSALLVRVNDRAVLKNIIPDL